MKALVAKAQLAKTMVAVKAMELASKKVKGVDGLVVALLLIVIAVACAVLFRTQIMTWFNTIMAQFTTQSQTLF